MRTPPRLPLHYLPLNQPINHNLQTSDMENTNDENVLLTIYKTLSDERIDYNVRKWEIIRTNSIIVFGILTGVSAIANTAIANNSVVNSVIADSSVIFYILGIMAILTGFIMSIWTFSNLKRESELQYYAEFSMYQIERLLGLHKKIKNIEDRWLPNYQYIFEKKHLLYRVKSSIKSNEFTENPLTAWVKGKIRKHKFLKLGLLYSSLLLFSSLGIGIIMIITGIEAN